MTGTKKELASLAGYTYRRLHDIDMSLPKDKKLFVEAEDGKYDVAAFVQRWVAYNVDKEKEDGGQSLDDIKAAHEAVKMEKTAIEVSRMRGELVPIGEVKILWGGIAHTVMSNMLLLPTKVAPKLIMIPSVKKIAEILENEIRATLEVIADTPIPRDDARESEDETED